MRSRFDSLLKFGSYVLAAFIALVLYRLWGPNERHAPPERTASAPAEAGPEKPALDQPARPRHRLIARQERVEPGEERDPTAPSAKAPARPAKRDREEAIRAEREEHAQRVAATRREPRDLGWAREMEGTLGETFKLTAVDTGASVGQIDCRSASCTVELKWPSYAEARMHMMQTVSAVAVGAPCARHLTLPETPSEDAEVTATMVVDCTETRWPTETAAPRR